MAMTVMQSPNVKIISMAFNVSVRPMVDFLDQSKSVTLFNASAMKITRRQIVLPLYVSVWVGACVRKPSFIR